MLARFIAISVAILFCFDISLSFAESKESNNKYYRQFQEIFELVDRDYVTEPEKQKMVDAAIEGMLSSLDPHSMYFNEEEFNDFLNDTKGEFGGIGVEIIPDNGAIKVISPIEDLPAEKVGIKAGDYIIAVNGEYVSDIGFNKAVKKMRGEPGTNVKLTIGREGESKPLELEITRAIVKIKAVKFNLEDQNVAYIRITTFNENTMDELTKAIQELKKQAKDHIKGIILDVRNNPGGLLDQAIKVTEYFLDSGVIVTTKGRIGMSNTSQSVSKFGAKAPNVPMVVLINGGSASGSEIIAGALQDHKRAIIMGTQSFGKGSVQLLYHLNKKSGLKLTIAKYYTPNGRSIQGEGITPDIIIEPAKVEYAKLPEGLRKYSEAALKNHLKKDEEDNKDKKDGSKAPDEKKKEDKEKSVKVENKMSETYLKDYQFARAYDLIRGLIINSEKVKKPSN